ncbi:MAG: recombinase family protein [Magnetococcales bacterium]|nr:recombinase family protein [Magnetococcales bacterium]
MPITINLPRELEDFLQSCAEAHHYRDLDHVVCNALRLLRQREEKRAEFIAILNVSATQAKRGEGISAEQVFREVDEIIRNGGRPSVYVDVEVSEWLARDAKRYGGIHQRSVGDQIEHWCRIGQIAEANPNTPYGVIFDECGLGLEPCDAPLVSIRQGLKEALDREDQRQAADKIMLEDRAVLRQLAEAGHDDEEDEPQTSSTPSRVALYIRTATVDPDREFLNKQMKQLIEYAAAHGMEIARSYVDEGKSGLTLNGREGLEELLDDIQSGRADFEAVLITGISRWGRFPGADAEIEEVIKKRGIRIEYCDQ